MRAWRSVLGLVLLVGLVVPAGAEVLAPPPVPEHPFHGEDGVLPDATTWLSLQRFTEGSGDPDHNYHYDLGSRFVFWRGDPFSVEGEIRMIFQSEMPSDWSDNPWLIDSSALVVGQTLRARYRIGDGSILGYFHHNSKHDLDRKRRRTPIHDAVGVKGISPLWKGEHPLDRSGEWAAWLTGRLEYALEPVFQMDEPEPYDGGVYLQADVEPWILDDLVTVFGTGRLSLLRGSVDDDAYWDLDYVARLGVRTPRRDRGIAVYGQVHRLHDDWRDDDSRGPDREQDPWTLVGVGIQFLY